MRFYVEELAESEHDHETIVEQIYKIRRIYGIHMILVSYGEL